MILIFFHLFLQFCLNNKPNNTRIKSTNSNHPLYKIRILNYDIFYDINENCSMKVTENITIYYQGIKNTGFKRLIPINNDVQIRNINVSQITQNGNEKVLHKVSFDSGNIIIGIGDKQNKYGKKENYSISYNFRILNEKIEQNNLIKLNAIGNKWECKIEYSTVKLNVPQSLTDAQCFIVYNQRTKYHDFNIMTAENNKKIITTTFNSLYNHQGVTFDLHFAPKSMKRYFDNYCNKYIILNIGILAVIIALSLFINYKNKICPIHYTTELDIIDPLMMSKLLNGNVIKSDVTSLVFYWASKGFIDINIENEEDPILIQKVDSIPDSYPSYQIYMFTKLFQNGDEIQLSELKYKFCNNIETIIKIVDSQTKARVNTSSVILSLLFATFGSISSFIAPMDIGHMISKEYSVNFFYFMIFYYVIWGLRFFMTFKYKNDTFYYFLWLIVLLCIACLAYEYNCLIPNFLITSIYKFGIFISSSACVICSVSLTIKSEYFMSKINEIYGIKEFIEKPANDEFHQIVKKDPELFYNLICYAQVLELNDQWKHKFDQCSSAALPKWFIISSLDDDYYNNYDSIFYSFKRMKIRMFDNIIQFPKVNHRGNQDIDYDHDDYGDHFSSDGYGGGGGYGT